MWRLLMSKAFLFYESVIRNGSLGLLEEGATERGCTKETRPCSIKGTECLTVGINQFNSVIGDRVLCTEPLRAVRVICTPWTGQSICKQPVRETKQIQTAIQNTLCNLYYKTGPQSAFSTRNAADGQTEMKAFLSKKPVMTSA